MNTFKLSQEQSYLRDLLKDEQDSERAEMLLQAVDDLESEKRLVILSSLEELDKDIDYMTEKMKELQSMKKLQQDKKEKLKTILLKSLQDSGEKSAQVDGYKISRRTGVDRVVVDDEFLLSDEFKKVKVEVDSTKLKKYLKENTSEYAHLEKGPESLMIKFSGV